MSAEQQNNEEVTIDLRRLFILIRKHIISILIWMIGMGLIAYGVSEYVLVPKYTASTQLLVNRKTTDASQAYTNQQADINAVTTYKDIITSNVILKGASKYLANPGKGFNVKVAQGDLVKAGQTLIEFDLDGIKEAGYDPTVMTVVTDKHDVDIKFPSVE